MKPYFRWWLLVLVTMAGVAFYIWASTPSPKRTFVVTYRVSGDAPYIKAFYAHGAFARDEIEIETLPWQKTVAGESGDKCIMVLAIGQTGGGAKGEIFVDGELVETCEASGADSTASCAPGVLP